MTELEKRVMDRIEAQKLVPRPFYLFLAKRSVFGLLTFISLLFGAVSFALALFIVSDFFATGGKGFDEMPFDEFVDALPLVWLASSLLLAVSATYSISNTRRGYRWRTSHVLAGAIAVSLALGTLMYSFDMGGSVHQLLSGQFRSYREATHIPYAEWSRPAAGFLGGEAQNVEGETLRLRDFRGEIWSVDISGAKIELENTIVDEGDVAVEGQQTGPLNFKATRIIPFD